MGRKVAHSAKDVIKAIKGTAGIQASIAKKLGVARQTVASYIERWPTVKAAYEEEKRGVDDAALSVVVGDIINNKDVSTAKWWLVRKMPDEFGDRMKHEDWRSEIVKALQSGTIKPEDIALIYPSDLAQQFFMMAGVTYDSD